MPANAGDIRAGRAYVSLGADSTELEAKVKRGQSLLQQLKEGLGSRSGLKDIAEIAVGAGAVAGLALSARLLKDMATGAAGFAEAMNKGGLEAGKAGEELLQSLPVLGEIRQAGLAIRELFTGEQAAVARINEEVSQLNALMDAQQRLAQGAAKSYEDMARVLRDLKNEAALIGLSGLPKELTQLQQNAEARRRDIADRLQKEIADLNARAAIDVGGKKLTPEQRRAQIVQELQALPTEGLRGRVREDFPELTGAAEPSALRQQLALIEKEIRERDEAIAKLRAEAEKAIGQLAENTGRDAMQKVVDADQKAQADYFRSVEDYNQAREKWFREEGQRRKKIDEEIRDQERTHVTAFGETFPNIPFTDRQHEQSHMLDVESLLNAVAGADRQFSSAGTFNPFAAGALSGGPLTQIERHTKDTARALEDIKNRGGLTYQ